MKANDFRKLSKTKVYAASITALFFFSLIAGVYYFESSRMLKRSVEDELLRNEQLLSEKLSLEKDIFKMKDRIAAALGKNEQLDQQLSKALASVQEKDGKIKSMTAENNNAKSLSRQVADLKTLKGSLEAQLNNLNNELFAAKKENEILEAQVAVLQSENSELNNNIALLSQVAVNNSLVEATKGKKDRLTVSARKTKKLKVGFDLPEEMIGNLYFQMTTPDGKLINSDHSTISLIEEVDNMELIASTGEVKAKTKKAKHIDMVYQPKEKLASGIYRIDVYSGSQYLGTTRVRLK